MMGLKFCGVRLNMKSLSPVFSMCLPVIVGKKLLEVGAMTRQLSLVIIVSCCLWGSHAFAGPRDIVISMSGFLGNTDQAAPVLQKLFRRLETSLGWPAKSIDGAYYPDTTSGLAHLKQDSPGFAVVSHQMYFEHGRAMKMKVIGGMELSEGALSRFHVITKKEGGPSSLQELVGRSLSSPHLTETAFVEKILLGGAIKLGPGADAVHPIAVRQPLQALRKVHRGQADAALVDEPVVAQLSKLPFGGELHSIHSSAKLPPLPVVALGGSNAADRGPMTKALLALCEGSEGAALCKSMRLSAVRPATAKTFSTIQRQMSQ